MRHKVISKEEILDIAGEIIKENGVKACSMRALAKEASIAVGTLYNYFSSNQALLEELFVASWQKTIEHLEEIPKEAEIERQIREFYRIINSEIKNRKGLGKELNSINAFAGKLGEAKDQIHGEIEKILFGFLKEAEVNRNCSDTQLKLVSRWILFSTLDSIISGKAEDEEIIEMLIRCYL